MLNLGICLIELFNHGIFFVSLRKRFSFGSPRSDTCKTCDTLNCRIKDSTNEESKSRFVEGLKSHHKIAELGFQSLPDDTIS